MSTSADPELLIDTSIAVAVTVFDHEHRASVIEFLGGRRLGLSGHAAFETYSVLTRLPVPARRPPAVVATLLATNFPHSRFLSREAADALPQRLAELGIAGGAVYDGLVGAAAAEHGLALVTRDRRAVDTYRALGVAVELLT